MDLKSVSWSVLNGETIVHTDSTYPVHEKIHQAKEAVKGYLPQNPYGSTFLLTKSGKIFMVSSSCGEVQISQVIEE